MTKVPESSPRWLAWAREIYSLSQSGLTYSKNKFDIKSYQRLQEIVAEMIAFQTELGKESALEHFSMQQGYATPKIDVRGAVIREGKILLVQEVADGKWCLPGGWGDIGEGPSAMVAREVWEESGFEVSVDKLIGVYDANRIDPLEFFHAYKLIFLCSITGGEAKPSLETLSIDFFDVDNLPALSEFRTNRAMIAEVFAHAADVKRPAYFE
jgi:ADP-ribose pyrophosphatase YjhB (NUDIX family)